MTEFDPQGFHDPAVDPHASYERHPVEDIEPLEETDFRRMGIALGPVLAWILNGYGIRRRTCHLRTVAFLYAVRPDLTGKNLREVARMAGCKKSTLQGHISTFRRLFNFRTVGQHRT